MEHQPHQPNGGEHQPERPAANSYGTDDPEVQARIEQARIDASQERRHNRARLEQLVEHGMSPDEAEALIEFEDAVRQQREETAQTARATESVVMPGQPVLDDDHCCRFCGAHFSNPCAPECPRNREETAPRYQPRIAVVNPSTPEHNRREHWVDAAQDPAELQAAISAALTDPETDNVIGPSKWIIRASTDFAGLDLTGFADLDLVARLAHGVAEHGAAYAVFVQIVSTSDRDQLDKFDDVYVGSFDSPEAWARSVGDDLEWGTHLDEVVDPMLRPYLTIDYARFAQESRASWDVLQGHDGKTHVFMR